MLVALSIKFVHAPMPDIIYPSSCWVVHQCHDQIRVDTFLIGSRAWCYMAPVGDVMTIFLLWLHYNSKGVLNSLLCFPKFGVIQQHYHKFPWDWSEGCNAMDCTCHCNNGRIPSYQNPLKKVCLDQILHSDMVFFSPALFHFSSMWDMSPWPALD